MLQKSFGPEQRWSPLNREQVRYSTEELPSKGTHHPRHVVERPGADSIVLPLNRMPSDRSPKGSDAESFDWGPFDVPDLQPRKILWDFSLSRPDYELLFRLEFKFSAACLEPLERYRNKTLQ